MRALVWSGAFVRAFERVVRVGIQADLDEAFEMPRCRPFRRPSALVVAVLASTLVQSSAIKLFEPVPSPSYTSSDDQHRRSQHDRPQACHRETARR